MCAVYSYLYFVVWSGNGYFVEEIISREFIFQKLAQLCQLKEVPVWAVFISHF